MPTVSDAWPALLLMGVIVSLPWLANWAKKTGWQGFKPNTSGAKVISAVAVGPQQRVVTVEIGEGSNRRWLILGVTAQSITRLDTLESAAIPDNQHSDERTTKTGSVFNTKERNVRD